jgi:hypothetical protein
VVVGTDDSTPGQVYVYAGQKRTAGSPIEKAGLVGGALYGIKVAGGLDELDNPASRCAAPSPWSSWRTPTR